MEEKKNNQEDRGETLTSWKFPEFKKQPKSKSWYTVMMLIAAAMVIFGIFTQNYLLPVLIALLIFIYLARSRHEPNRLEIKITEDGIAIGQNTFYEWKDIKKFWIIYEPPEVKNLYFDFKAGLRPSVSISLEDQNPINVRKILLEYLQEDTEKENESFSDGLGRIMKL